MSQPQLQVPRSQSVSRANDLYRSAQPPKQVSFSSSPQQQQQHPPRRAQSSLRPVAGTPRHREPPPSSSSRPRSTGRAASEPGGAFSLDYDDPEQVTRAILRLREQRERDAAERRPSRTKTSRSRGGGPKEMVPTQPKQQQQQQRPNVLEPKQITQITSAAAATDAGGTSNNNNQAFSLQQQLLQPPVALQKSHSHGSSHSGASAALNNHVSTQQRYRSPSPSLAQRQGPPAATASTVPQLQPAHPLLHTLSNQSSSSTENHHQYDSTRKTGLSPRGATGGQPHQQSMQQLHDTSATPRIANGPQLHKQQQQPGGRKASPSPTTTRQHGGVTRNHHNHHHLALHLPSEPPEKQTKETLQHAEQRIDGLLEELEELRFFQELEIECDQQLQQQQNPQKVLGAMRPATPTNNRAAAVPQMIGVPSNTATGNGQLDGASLPPPPINFMDPREIGKLDRHTLELEAQKMVRSIQLLNSEKMAVEAEMQVLTTNSSQHKQRIQQLEQALAQVQKQLVQAKKDMESIRTTLVQQYESKLSENVEKLQQTQRVVDTLREDRDQLRVDMDQRLTQMKEREQTAKKDLNREREAAQAREAVLELQLAEVVNTVEELKRRLKEKDHLVEDLRRHVDQAQEALHAAKQQLEESHQEEIKAMEEQLKRAESKYREACDERDGLCQQLQSQQAELEQVQQQCQEQSGMIVDLTERLDLVHNEYRQKFGELKDVYEAKEKRRLNEMVVSQSKQVEEYERRILAMQQQLTMATDRHHAEIRQKEASNEAALERERKRIREQLEDERQRATDVLVLELERAKKDYEEAERDRQMLRAASAASNKDHLASQKAWEDKDKQRLQDIAQLQQQVERLIGDLSEKDTQILDLTVKMSDSNKKHEERLIQMEKQNAANILARDETIAQHKRKLREAAMDHKDELVRRDAELAEAQAVLSSRISELEIELSHANASLEQTRKSLESTESASQKLLEVRASLDQVQTQLKDERIAHEGVEAEMRAEKTKLESRLSSYESNLQDKVKTVEELESKLQVEADSFAATLQEKQKRIDSLTEQLTEAQEQLSKERTKGQAQAAQIAQLELDKSELHLKVEKCEHFETLSIELQSKVELLESTTDELEKTKEQLTRDLESLRHAEGELQVEKRTLEAKVCELQQVAQNLKQENDDLQESSDAVEANIRRLRVENEDLVSRASQLQDARSCIEDLNKQLSTQQDEAMQSLLELTQTKLELEDYRQRLKEYESKLDQTSNIASDLEIRAQRASQVSNLYATTAKELQEKVETEMKAKAQLREQIESLKRDLVVKDTELLKTSELEVQLTEAVAARDALAKQLESVSSDLQLKSQKLAELELQLSEMSKAREIVSDRIRRAEESLSLKTIEASQLQELISTQKTQLEERSSELTLLAEEKEKLQKDFGHVETELKEKMSLLHELQKSHSSEEFSFKSQVEELALAKAKAESQLKALDAELALKSEKVIALEKNISELRASDEQAAKQNDELRSKLHRTEAELQENGRRLSELVSTSEVSSLLKSQVEQLTKLKTSLETKLRDLEEEREDREKHMQASAERYSNQIVDLQMQVEDLTASKSSLRAKLAEAEEELEKKTYMLRSTTNLHTADLNSLRERLAEQMETKGKLEARIAELEAQLTQGQRESTATTERAVEELQAQLDTSIKENRSLKLRIGDVERELERKEKQIKDVVNRYSQEITALNDKLEDQTKESRSLQNQLAEMKLNNESISDVSNEAHILKERVVALERSIDVERALTRDAEKAKKRLEMEMVAVETSKKELQERFEKVNGERNEVIAALEEVIHEVQSREDEIDALAEALRRREHELDHAKLIASKALASAQEIKARYKDRAHETDDERNEELESQIVSLSTALGQARKSNNSLQRKLARLEEELTKREGEYSELKEQLEQSENPPRLGKIDQFVARSKPAEPPMCRQNESASTAASTVSDGKDALDSPSQSIGFAETMSDVGAGSDQWGFQQASSGSADSSDSVSFAGIRAEPGDPRAVERDALRKYVRKRYMSSKSSAST